MRLVLLQLRFLLNAARDIKAELDIDSDEEEETVLSRLREDKTRGYVGRQRVC